MGQSSQSGRRNWRSKVAPVALAFLFLVPFSASPAQLERPGTVYRGLHPGGMWIELADDGAGDYALTILDGPIGHSPEPFHIPMKPDDSNGSCRLVPDEGNFVGSVEGCPRGGTFVVEVKIGAVGGKTVLQEVGWNGSFAWGEPVTAGGTERQACAMTSLTGFSGINGTVFKPALEVLSAEVAAMPSGATSDPRQMLPGLRAERMRAYSILTLSPIEAQQAERIEAAVAGRPVLGRSVPMSEATRMKQEFDARVTNGPMRQQARQTLLQVDRSLSAIYDVASANRRQAASIKLQNQTAPSALEALESMLSAGQPSRIEQLLGLETVVGELDSCLSAINPGSPPVAHPAVRASLANRSSELAQMLQIAMANAGTSEAAIEALGKFERNQVVREALQAGGYSDRLTAARIRIAALSAEEERRAAVERAAQAAADRAGIAAGGRSGQLNVARIARTVVLVLGDKSRGSGFIVAPGVVVTNVHVIEGNREVSVVVNGERQSASRPARVIAQYPIHDIAVLRVDNLPGPIARVSGTEPAQGAPVWALGFPGLADSFDRSPVWDATLTNGVVSRPVYGGIALQAEGQGETRLVQHTATILSGNSGGPLFDACHRVVAVNTQIASRGAGEVFTSVSVRILPELLRQAGVSISPSSGTC